jgi:nucleotide-binding universal stress UspA family protein
MTDEAERMTAVEAEESRGRRVVVGIDYSTGARAALLFGLHDAARRDLPVEGVVAYQTLDPWMDLYVLGRDEPDRARTVAVEHAQAFVAGVLPDGPQPPPPLSLRVVSGSAADALVRASHEAELLVVGSRGHGGFSSMLLGSVSMQCVLHAVCPVTVVHSPESHRERLHLRRSRHAGVGPTSLPVL